MFNEKELLDKMNKDKDYRSDILIDLNVTLQFMEHYTDVPKDKISPREYKIAVVSLECENQELRQRIDKAIEFIENSYYSKNTTDINNIVFTTDKLLQTRNILKGGNNAK